MLGGGLWLTLSLGVRLLTGLAFVHEGNPSPPSLTRLEQRAHHSHHLHLQPFRVAAPGKAPCYHFQVRGRRKPELYQLLIYRRGEAVESHLPLHLGKGGMLLTPSGRPFELQGEGSREPALLYVVGQRSGRVGKMTLAL